MENNSRKRNPNETSSEISKKIKEINTEMDKLKKVLLKSDLTDPEMQKLISSYKKMGLSDTEIKKRIISRYAAKTKKLELSDHETQEADSGTDYEVVTDSRQQNKGIIFLEAGNKPDSGNSSAGEEEKVIFNPTHQTCI